MVIRIILPDEVRRLSRITAEKDRPSLCGIHVNIPLRLFEVVDGFTLFRMPFGQQVVDEAVDSVPSFLIQREHIDSLFRGHVKRAADVASVEIDLHADGPTYALRIQNEVEVRRQVAFVPVEYPSGFPDLSQLIEESTQEPDVYQVTLSPEVLQRIADMGKVSNRDGVRFEFRNEIGMVYLHFENTYGLFDENPDGAVMPLATPVMTSRSKARQRASRSSEGSEA